MVKTIAHLTLPFALLDDGVYDVSIDGKIAKIELQREKTTARMGQVQGMEVLGNVQMENDFHGLVNITRVKIELPYLIYPSKTRPKSDGTLEDLSHDHHVNVQKDCMLYLNRLIQVVRWHTRKFWINNLSGFDINLNKFDLFDDNERNIGGQIHGQPIYTPFKLPNLTVYQKDIQKEILQSLKTEDKIPVYDALYLDALDDFSRGQFNKAVMTINIALESTITDYLLSELVKQGKTRDEAKKQVDKYLKFDKKREGRSGFHKILANDFKDVTGRSLEKDEPELWKEFENTRNKRKTTIHPYVGRLNEEKAREAFLNAVKIMNWVLQQGRYPENFDYT